MPPLLSTTTQLSTAMMTNEGEQDIDGATIVKEEESVPSSAATNSLATSQSVTSAGQSVWTIGKCTDHSS